MQSLDWEEVKTFLLKISAFAIPVFVGMSAKAALLSQKEVVTVKDVFVQAIVTFAAMLIVFPFIEDVPPRMSMAIGVITGMYSNAIIKIAWVWVKGLLNSALDEIKKDKLIEK